ncbi:cytochrome P450 2C42-like [Paramacrobiotus metropolitanus]|uniref:cytochrome P450 2C42-like n=1 Tax=Paramacrobiotus metropolitanus TaxID=2943436 RepID=UPI002445F14E|nr:cytochrome P450 2C42-like [Paramacrobiotus metropolitanus]
MLSVSVFLGSAAFFAVIMYILQRWSKSHPGHAIRRPGRTGVLPPQPAGWPLLGHLMLLLKGHRHRRIQSVGREMGGCMTLKLGPRKSVWITSYGYFRDAVINHAWEFAGRPPEVTNSDFSSEHGIAASGVSEPEREIRKFTLISLRSFGFGKSTMQDTMLHEVNELVKTFRQHCPTHDRPLPLPFNPRNSLANAAANVISSVLMGKRFQPDDPNFIRLSDDLTEAIKKVMISQQARSFPLLRLLFLNRGIKSAHDAFRRAHDFVTEIVQEHVHQNQPRMPRDFADDWLDKAADEAAKGKTTFAVEHLPAKLLDLFIGGFETTATAIQWILLMLLHHPHVQINVHDEIDRVIGPCCDGQQITLEHREHLVYTEAVILETLRKYPLAPYAVPHMCVKETQLGDYIIPEGTQVMLHLYSILHDPQIFPEPENFRPERFISPEGRLSIPEQFVPFSAGRRACIGEQLARKELFVFFANIMHSFTVSARDPAQLPSLNENEGSVMYPDPYEIILHER